MMGENTTDEFTQDENHEMFTWFKNSKFIKGKSYVEELFLNEKGEMETRKIPADRKTAIADMGAAAILQISKLMESSPKSQKIPSKLVAAVGIYQMFYDKEGNLRNDNYEKMSSIKTDLGKFIDTVVNDKWAGEDSNLTLGEFTDKIANDEPIFLPSTQEKVMETYQNKFKSASKDANKAPADPKPKEMENSKKGKNVNMGP